MTNGEWLAIAVELFGGLLAISILAAIVETKARARRYRMLSEMIDKHVRHS